MCSLLQLFYSTSGSVKASIDSTQTSGHGRLAGQIHLRKLTCGQFDLRAALF